MVTRWKSRKFDTPFRTDYNYDKELMSALPLTVNALHKEEKEYNGKFGHNVGRIKHCYLTCHL